METIRIAQKTTGVVCKLLLLFAFAITIVLCFALSLDKAFADTYRVDYTNGYSYELDDSNYTATLIGAPIDENGRVTISGTLIVDHGEPAYNIVAIGSEAFRNRSDLQTVCFRGCTALSEIGESAFEGCENLSMVDTDEALETRDRLPNSIETIGDRAFKGCNLRATVLPENLTSVGDYAFGDCGFLETSNVSSVVIPTGVIAVGDHAFENCGVDISFASPSSLQSIGEYAFCGAGSRSVPTEGTVIIPSSVSNIGDYAFSYANYRSISFEEGSRITSFGEGAFSGSEIEQFTIPPSVSSISFMAFAYCRSLGAVTFEEGSVLKRIENKAFSGCSISKFELPDSCQDLQGAAFEDCKKMQAFTAGSGLNRIGADAFRNCEALSIVTLNEGLRRIESAFENCPKLSSITIPSTVEVLDHPFIHCDSLSEVTFLGSVAPKVTPLTNADHTFTYCFADVADTGVVRYRGCDKNGYSQFILPELPEGWRRVPLFQLTVTGGSIKTGLGNLFEAGRTISLSADGTGPCVMWSSNSEGTFSPDNEAETDFIMPSSDVLVSVSKHDSHSLTEKEGRAPTYNEAGLEKHWVCNNCGKLFLDDLGQTEVRADDLIIPKKTAPNTSPLIFSIAYHLDGGVNADSNPSAYAAGSKTELAAPTKSGYEFQGWFTDASLTKQVTAIDAYQTGDVELWAKWAKLDAETFPDVDCSAWYAPGVEFVQEKGLMTGYSNTGLFGVGKTLTRGELATILWRHACPDEAASYDPATAKDETNIKGSADGQFYTAAANWAAKSGIITGYVYEDGTQDFAANDPVTFEQLITILARFATNEAGADPANNDLSAFADGDEASSWAAPSLKWAADNGLVEGYPTSEGKELAPTENVLRERVAVVLMRAFKMGVLG